MFRANNSQHHFLFGGLVAAMLIGIMSCASTGTPGGGLYDEDPPELRTSTPAEGATQVSDQRIVLRFNENIKLDKVNEKMTISPPQSKSPLVMSNAKMLSIELQDTLMPNTTYSINLGDAVQDNNEGNPMKELSLLFSTGSHIDSLQIAGHMLNASNLEPITGAFVGIYKMYDADGNPVLKDSLSAIEMADSILLKYPFERIGKTDALGAFKIEGIAPGTYRLYGLNDGNTNYRYDLITEDIAFCEDLITPTMSGKQKFDTLWIDSLTIDTIKVSGYIDYQPNNLLLRSFNEGKVNRYLDEYSRPDSNRIEMRFAARMEELPKFTLLHPDSTSFTADTILLADSFLIAEPNPTLDTLVFWIKHPELIHLDSLYLAAQYAFTDTTQTDILRTDTLFFEKPIVRVEEPEEKADKPKKRGRWLKGKDEDQEQEAEPDTLPVVTFMELKMISNGSIEIGAKPKFETSAPLDSLHVERFHLEQQHDTLWLDMPLQFVPDSLHPRRFSLIAEPHFSPGGNYRLTADSAAMHDIYGQPLKATKFNFKEKKQEDYAHLMFTVNGVNGPAFIELLNAKDQPVQHAKVTDGIAKFVHVPANTYYARLIMDANNNGKFDTGSLFEHIQPEEVFYFSAPIVLRANWEMNQNWNLNELPLLQQKPKEVKINKPKEEKEKKSRNEEYLRKLGKIP